MSNNGRKPKNLAEVFSGVKNRDGGNMFMYSNSNNQYIPSPLSYATRSFASGNYNTEADTQRRVLDYLKIRIKTFEEQKLASLLDTILEKHSNLSREQILLFSDKFEFEDIEFQSLIPEDLLMTAKNIAKITNTDIFSSVMALIAAISIALRSRYSVKLDENWDEMLNIYMMIAKYSGGMKSKFVEMLGIPHKKFLSQRRHPKSQQNSTLRDLQNDLQKAAKERKSACIAHHTDYIRKHGEALESMKSLVEKLKCLKNDSDPYIIQNAVKEEIFWDVSTPLALPLKLQDHGETLAMMVPEASLLFSKFFNDKSFILLLNKCYGGESHQYDTTTPGRSIDLVNPSLNMLLMIQTNLMIKSFDDDFLNSIGFTPRVLPIFAGKYNELQQIDYSFVSKIDTGCMDLYHEKILNLLEFNFTQDNNREIWKILCEKSAYLLIKKFQKENELDLEAGRYKHMESFIRKLHGHAVRIAGIIHAWNYSRPHEHPITLKEMQAGICLAKIVREHANFAFDTKSRETKHFAIKILEYLLRQDWTRSLPLISASDLFGKARGLKMDKCLPALDFLEQHNFIRQHHEPKYQPLCILHPNLFQLNLDQSTDI